MSQYEIRCSLGASEYICIVYGRGTALAISRVGSDLDGFFLQGDEAGDALDEINEHGLAAYVNMLLGAIDL